jgi:molecular chaperone DnaK (HSP70)
LKVVLYTINPPLTKLKSFSELSTSDITAVEIVGGSSRVPAVKSLVQKVFGIEPSTTLNADEAVSRGCALQNAILNPTFRVRDFSINDAQPYSITLSWQATMEEDR